MRFLFIFLAITAFTQLAAQDNPLRAGRLVTDIDFAFESGNFDQANAFFSGDISTDRTEFSSEIDFGYTIIDNLMIGLGLVIDNEKLESTVPASADGSFPASSAENTQNGLAALVTARYFFSNGMTKPFIGAGAGLLSLKRISGNGGSSSESSGSGFTYSGKVGVAHFINDHVGFELLYQYQAHSVTVDNSAFGSTYETEESAGNSRIFFGVIVAF